MTTKRQDDPFIKLSREERAGLWKRLSVDNETLADQLSVAASVVLQVAYEEGQKPGIRVDEYASRQHNRLCVSGARLALAAKALRETASAQPYEGLEAAVRAYDLKAALDSVMTDALVARGKIS
jgi:hypothetical protein